jgi:hypothetical protein
VTPPASGARFLLAGLGAGLLLFTAACSATSQPPSSTAISRPTTTTSTTTLVSASTSPSRTAANGPPPWTQLVAEGGDFWLIGTYHCGRSTCLALARSTNEGRPFDVIDGSGVRRAHLGPGGQDFGPFSIANSHDMYAPVPDTLPSGGELYRSDDGGATWARVDLPGAVASFVTTGGRAYALLRTCAAIAGECLRFALASSAVGSSSWRMTPLPANTDGNATLAAFGAHVWIAFDPPRSERLRLLVSSDAGRTFASVATSLNTLGCRLTATSATVLWGFCGTGMLGYGIRSTSGGLHFGLVGDPGAAVNSATITPFNAEVAEFDIDKPFLSITRDGGHHFTDVLRSSLPYANFAVAYGTARTWLALEEASGGERLWLTRDAGRMWAEVPMPRR